jgi:type IX secretion system PorP/SprF family membrane protein
MVYNPGYAGSKDAICLGLLHREQWVGLKGAPKTSAFTVNLPINPFKITSGIGLSVVNDVVGFEKNVAMNFTYAYRMDIKNGEGKLGIGVSGGFYNKNLDASKWLTPEGTDGSEDNAIPGQKESAMAFNLGLGIYYRTDKLYLGISSTNLTQSKFKFAKGEPNLTRQYYLTAGYSLALPNPSLDLQPSVFIVTDGRSSSFDINSILTYNKRIWGGVTYRLNSAIVGMLGIELKNGIRIGYSYDYATSAISQYSKGSHEILINYCFNVVKEKMRRKYKSVRFL